MTLKETVLYEIETADEELLQEVIGLIRWHRLSGRESRKHMLPTDRTPNHPLRRIPIVIPADFNEPMTDLWEVIELGKSP